jgi:hypothetical protein
MSEHTLRLPAVRGEIFAAAAAESMVGKPIGRHGGKVVAAEVIEGGLAALLTIVVPSLEES